jgi:hypothetical protein
VFFRLPGSSGHRRHRRRGLLGDVAYQNRLGVALPGPDQWSALAFGPDGSDLVAFYGDGTGLVWEVDPDRWKQRACTIAGGPLTRDEWEELPGQRYEPACQ